MKFLFLKILLLILIFGSGINVMSEKYKNKPGMTLANMFVNIIMAILMGIAVCMLP